MDQANLATTPMRMPGGRIAQRDAFDTALAGNGNLLVGSPETVGATIADWITRLSARPTFYFAPAVQWGDITLAESAETIRLLADEVTPAVRARLGSREA